VSALTSQEVLRPDPDGRSKALRQPLTGLPRQAQGGGGHLSELLGRPGAPCSDLLGLGVGGWLPSLAVSLRFRPNLTLDLPQLRTSRMALE
jgi:hypothetical protein